MKYYYTYKVQCTAVGWEDYYYLGKHVTTNLDDGYKGSGTKLQEYYKQYPNDYTFTILAFYKDKNELNIAEQKLIGDLWKTDEYCLNGNAGGAGSWSAATAASSICRIGRPLSEEHKRKISEARKGKSPANKGKPLSDKQKEILSITHKGNQYFKGRHHTDEAKRKMSEARKGKPVWNKGKPHSNDTKNKISAKLKGRIPWNKGLKQSQLTLASICECLFLIKEYHYKAYVYTIAKNKETPEYR